MHVFCGTLKDLFYVLLHIRLIGKAAALMVEANEYVQA